MPRSRHVADRSTSPATDAVQRAMVLGLPALPPKPSPRKGALRSLTLASLGLAAQNAVSGTWAHAGCSPPLPQLESSQMHNAQQQHWSAEGLADTVQLPPPPQPAALPQQQWQEPAAPLPVQQQEQRQPSTNSAAGVSWHSGERGYELTSPDAGPMLQHVATKRNRQPENSAGPSGGTRISPQTTAAAGASSQPPSGRASKRRRRASLPSSGRGASVAAALPSASPTDLVGAVVEVPGSIFSVDPCTRFVGLVTKPERGRGMPAVELRFRDGDVYCELWSMARAGVHPAVLVTPRSSAALNVHYSPQGSRPRT